MCTKRIYLFILPIIACLVFSCTSEVPDDMASLKGTKVAFDVSNFSRSSVVTSIDQFVVFGDIKSMGDEASNPLVMFNKTKVVYKDNSWVYDNIQYWMNNCEHSFVAVYPGTLFETGSDYQYSNSHLSFEYSIPASGGILSSTGDVADILAATHRRLYVKDKADVSEEKSITLTFSHLLSLINIAPAFYDNIMSPKDSILVHELKFSGVTTKARFDIVPAARLTNTRTDDRVMEVTGQGEGNLTIRFTTPVKIENNGTNVNLFAENDAIIMIPRTFTADAESEITMSYTINEDDTMKQVSLPLNDRKWESGKSYRYKFTIARTGLISNSTTITDWIVTNVGNINMQ